MRYLRHCGFVVGLVVHLGCGTVPPAPVSPQRAAFSSDPSTTAKSTLEVEAGFFVADNQTRDIPVALKWGATETAELFVAWSPYVRLAVRDGHTHGAGDLAIGTRVRFREETAGGPAAAFEMAAKLPVADSEKEIGSGFVDFFTAATVAKHLGHAGLIVGFYQLGVLSHQDPLGTLLEHTLSIALSRELSGQLQGYAEMAGVFNPRQDLEALLVGLGVGYEWNPRLIFDLECYVGLTNDASPVAISIGMTTNLGSLY